MLNWLSVDGKKLLFTRVLRTFAYGYLTVILGVYLDALGMNPTEIGFILAAAIAGSARPESAASWVRVVTRLTISGLTRRGPISTWW